MDRAYRVAVVVLNYKGIEDTITCINSLSRQTYTKFIIIVVENGSDDNSIDELKNLKVQYNEKLQILYNDKNLGFDGGVNTGIRWAMEKDFDYVALFNNDAVAEKTWLKNLVDAARKQKSGITTSLLLHENGKTIDSSGDWYSKWGLPFPRNRGAKASRMPDSGYVFGATGAASLYSTKMLHEIGLFDEDFFAYYEDVDISFRAQLYGWKIYYERSAIAYHKQGATSSKMKPGFTTYQTFKNLPLVFIKNVPAGLLLPIGARFYFVYWILFINNSLRGRGWSALKGMFMSVLLGFKVLGARHRIQKNKKVTTEYIQGILWDDLPPDQTGLRKLMGKKL